MNIIEMFELAKKIYLENEDEYSYIGLRFEDKERNIGDICDNSRHNADREDERDFPEYGTDEYFKMGELDGTSVWDLSNKRFYKLPMMAQIDLKNNRIKDCSHYYEAYHCYVIAGNELGRHEDPDDYEILIKDGIVIAQIF